MHCYRLNQWSPAFRIVTPTKKQCLVGVFCHVSDVYCIQILLQKFVFSYFLLHQSSHDLWDPLNYLTVYKLHKTSSTSTSYTLMHLP